jgi:hypothetical protein
MRGNNIHTVGRGGGGEIWFSDLGEKKHTVPEMEKLKKMCK